MIVNKAKVDPIRYVRTLYSEPKDFYIIILGKNSTLANATPWIGTGPSTRLPIQEALSKRKN